MFIFFHKNYLICASDRRADDHRASPAVSILYFCSNFNIFLLITHDSPLPKAEAIAAEIGCRVSSEVTKKTTLLVEGRQDIRKLAGHEKSKKRRRAEELIEQGVPLKILNEAQFETLVLKARHSYQRQLSLFSG